MEAPGSEEAARDGGGVVGPTRAETFLTRCITYSSSSCSRLGSSMSSVDFRCAGVSTGPASSVSLHPRHLCRLRRASDPLDEHSPFLVASEEGRERDPREYRISEIRFVKTNVSQTAADRHASR